MGAIYNSQIQWQSPESVKVQAEPVRDYLSRGFAAVGEAADAVGKQIQLEQNKVAADRMSLAATEAQQYINDFEDFSGDNYMDVMVSGAQKIWDDAYAQLDESTARRFDMNNPEFRNVLSFKIQTAAVEKTYNHVRDQYTRRIAQDATSVVSLGDPNEMKAAMQHQIEWMEANSGMRASDLNDWIDKFRGEVADGAIAQAVGEGRAEDAAALNNDLEFTATMTPAARAKNNVAIQELLKAQKASATGTATDAEKQYKKAIEDGLVSAVRDQIRAAGSDPEARDLVFSSLDKFIMDASRGVVPDTIMGIPIEARFPELKKAIEEVPYDILMDAMDTVKTKFLQRDPDYAAKIGRQELMMGSVMATFDKDDNGDITIDEVDSSKLGQILEILDQTKDSVLLNSGSRNIRSKLQNIADLKAAAVTMELRPTAETDADTEVLARAGLLPWGTKDYFAPAFAGGMEKFGEYPMDGNLSYSAMQNMRTPGTEGLESDDEFTAALETSSNRIARALDGKDAERGTNRDALYKTMAHLMYSNKLGTGGISDEEVLKTGIRMAHALEKKGILDSPIDVDEVGFRPSSLRSNLADMEPKEREDNVRKYLNTERGKEEVRKLKKDYGLTDKGLDILIKNGKIPESMAYEAVTSENSLLSIMEEARDTTTGVVSPMKFLNGVKKVVFSNADNDIVDASAEQKKETKGFFGRILDTWKIDPTDPEPDMVKNAKKLLGETPKGQPSLLTLESIKSINDFYDFNVKRPLNEALAASAEYRSSANLGEYSARIMAKNKEAAMIAEKANSCVTGIKPADIIPMSKPIQESGAFSMLYTMMHMLGVEDNQIDSNEIATAARRTRSSFKVNYPLSPFYMPKGKVKEGYGAEVAESLKKAGVSY